MNYRLPAVLLGCALMLGACASTPNTPQARAEDTAEAQGRVDKAVAVVDQMKTDPSANALLREARGVMVVPDYGKAGFIVGGQGGVGVLMARHGGEWSDPAFFTIGGLSIGLQAGGEVGSIAYVLMTEKAVDAFESHTNKFTLGADAGLTVVSYTGNATIAATTPPADVVVWSGAKGLFGGVSVGATDVVQNTKLDESYYQGFVNTRQILAGQVTNPHAHDLRVALNTRVASK